MVKRIFCMILAAMLFIGMVGCEFAPAGSVMCSGPKCSKKFIQVSWAEPGDIQKCHDELNETYTILRVERYQYISDDSSKAVSYYITYLDNEGNLCDITLQEEQVRKQDSKDSPYIEFHTEYSDYWVGIRGNMCGEVNYTSKANVYYLYISEEDIVDMN